ncbi:hypothetical protein [Roseibium sp.]|uniref:hypothetical protein n=1 Tax=Roseibium sp. TaxID=1936156 RepID=UPI003A974A16
MAKDLIAAMGITALIFAATSAAAGEVVIENAEAVRQNGHWRFSVTLRHQDEGWDHYADLWQVLAPDGTVLGDRVLAHPHVNEQPFTRSLGRVAIPEGIDKVFIRARDSRHGLTEELYEIGLKGI